jgi:hypothetical protein
LDVTVRGREADVEVRVAAADLGEPTGLSALVVPTREQAVERAERAVRYVAARIAVWNGGAVCSAEPGSSAIQDRSDGFALAVAVRYRCARQIDDLRLRDDLFFDLDPRHQAFVEVRAFGSTRELVIRSAEREVRIQGRPSLLAEVGDYLALGIEHIFTGYDHIAFLFGLLIIAGALGRREGVRYALTVVTAFTLAHSITLIAAALGWVRLPSRWVESAIAVSIFYVAVENLMRPSPRGRWLLTFGFGLVHGFGFASVLAEMGLPRHGLLLSLFAFNAGVEVGQVLVVCAAFPILVVLHERKFRPRDVALVVALTLAAFVVLSRFDVPPTTVAVVAFGGTAALALATRRYEYDRAVRLGGSAVLAALALFWLAERVSAHVWLRGVLG